MSLLAGCSVFICIAWLALSRAEVFLCFFLILFTFAWRTVSSMYIDLYGPVYASQISLFIGPGVMTAFQSTAYFLTVVPFLWVFSPAATDQWVRSAHGRVAGRPILTLSDVTFYGSLIFLVLLFGALVEGGVLPILAKMERWTFNERAGWLHHFVLLRGDFICFWWGTIFAAEKLRHDRFDYRFLGLLALLMIYIFLAGGRFSPFYRFGSFFIMPFSAVVLVHSKDAMSNGLSGLRSLIPDRRIVAAGFAMFVLASSLIAFALYWNLTKVRGFEGKAAEAAFLERVMVQPSEMGWASYQRVFVNGQWDARKAVDFLFERPIAGGRNTTPQFLMSETIGEPRTTELTVAGFQFAGGFPEIFFEVFGPYLGWLMLLGAGWLCAAVSALVVRSIVRGEYLVVACAFQVLFGFYVMYIGGMLNFATIASYWMKVGLLFIAMVAEYWMKRVNLSLLPWAIVDHDRILWFRRKQSPRSPLGLLGH
jgi:Family of unknown function (DUF6418)